MSISTPRQQQQQQGSRAQQFYLSEQSLKVLDDSSNSGGDDGENQNDDALLEDSHHEHFPPPAAPLLMRCPLIVQVLIRNNAVFIKLAAPSALVQLLRNAILTLGFVFAGQLRAAEVAGFVLASSWTNALGVSFVMGFSSILDSFLPQVFGRSGHTPALGVYLRASLFFVLCASVLYFVATSYFASAVLGKIAVRREIVEPAQQALVPSFLTVFGTGCASALNKFFNAQRRPALALYGYAAATVLTIALFAFVVPRTPGGISLAVGIGRCSAAASMIFFGSRNADISLSWALRSEPPQQGSDGSSGSSTLSDSFQPQLLREFAVLAVPSVISNVADRWIFEVMSLMLAWRYRDDPAEAAELGAFGCLTTIWIFLFPFGVACYVAGGTLVGNAVGEGSGGRKAKAAAHQALRLTALTCGFAAVVAFIVHSPLVNAMVKDEHARKKAKNNFALFICFAFFADALQFVLQGILRACHCPGLSPTVNFVAYSAVGTMWGVGLPISFLLSFWGNLGLIGVGVGMFVGCAANAAVQYWFLSRISWDALVFAIHTSASSAAGNKIHVPRLDLSNAAAVAAANEQTEQLHEELDALDADRGSQKDGADDANDFDVAPDAGNDDERDIMRHRGSSSWENE